jgi:hypothetical protein
MKRPHTWVGTYLKLEKEVDLQSSTSLEELLSNGAESGEKNAMQQKKKKTGRKGDVFIGG